MGSRLGLHYQHISVSSGIITGEYDKIREVEQLDFVESVVPFVPELKTHNKLSCDKASETIEMEIDFMTLPLSHDSFEELLNSFEVKMGKDRILRNNHPLMKKLAEERGTERQFGRIRRLSSKSICEKALEELSSSPSVMWIQEHFPNKLLNKWAGYSSQSGVEDSTPLWDEGLTGDGQVVGISDTGIDMNHGFFYDSSTSAPFDVVSTTHRKVTTYITHVDSTDADEGHGTHVCGSAMGDTSSGGDNFRGTAPDAKVPLLFVFC